MFNIGTAIDLTLTVALITSPLAVKDETTNSWFCILLIPEKSFMFKPGAFFADTISLKNCVDARACDDSITE
ncbi:Uncharacterised protein [Enterobacter hormaechei]|nr:Uncharacterised protein [Enterobacter hormaechei]